MLFGNLKRKMGGSKWSDCASALKKVSIQGDTLDKLDKLDKPDNDLDDSSGRSGQAWSSMQSMGSWRSDDSQESALSCVALPKSEPKSTLPRDKSDAFARQTILRLKNWMPGVQKEFDFLSRSIEQANGVVGSLVLPGDGTYVPVHPSDPMLGVFGYLDIDAIAIALGASYFQRLLKKKPSMMDGARLCGWFVEAEDGAGNMQTFMRSVYSEQHTGLMVIYAVCCYVAAKLADRISYKRQLSALLFALLDSPVPESVAIDLEARVLAKLDWHLGPVCE
jgi:hypothetical protein